MRKFSLEFKTLPQNEVPFEKVYLCCSSLSLYAKTLTCNVMGLQSTNYNICKKQRQREEEEEEGCNMSQ